MADESTPPTSDNSAIGDRREQIANLPRPQRLGDADIGASVEKARLEEDLVKVYRPEWVIVYTSKSSGQEGVDEVHEFFNKKYEGRLFDEDWQVVPSSPGQPEKWPQRLRIRVPNIKGEFKTREGAEDYVSANGWADAVVVARNSKDEYKLKDYGVKKLGRGTA